MAVAYSLLLSSLMCFLLPDTDRKDSEWLADLLRHGLLKASFIPPAPIRELRELTRYRKSLVEERTSEINRLHKVLEGGQSQADRRRHRRAGSEYEVHARGCFSRRGRCRGTCHAGQGAPTG